MARVFLLAAFSLSMTVSAHAIDSSGAVVLNSVTIHNNNCSPWGSDHVRVNVYDPLDDRNWLEKCTSTTISLKHGATTTLTLNASITSPEGDSTKACVYRHEAEGTVGGSRDVHGDAVSHVTCKNDWAGVCQCKKD